jgi:hypothetical protein
MTAVASDPAPAELSAIGMPHEMSDRGRGLAMAHRVLDQLSCERARNSRQPSWRADLR